MFEMKNTCMFIVSGFEGGVNNFFVESGDYLFVKFRNRDFYLHCGIDSDQRCESLQEVSLTLINVKPHSSHIFGSPTASEVPGGDKVRHCDSDPLWYVEGHKLSAHAGNISQHNSHTVMWNHPLQLRFTEKIHVCCYSPPSLCQKPTQQFKGCMRVYGVMV